MIFKTPYSTLALNGYVLNKVTADLDRYKDFGFFKELVQPDNKNVLFIDAETTVENPFEIHPFTHPFVLEDKVFIDLRPFTKYNMRMRIAETSNLADYQFSKTRAHLTQCCLDDYSFNFVKNMSELPVSVYASWISENVAKRFSLDPGTQYRIMILSAIYYYTLFMNDADWNENNKQALVLRINRELKVNSDDIFALIDGIESPLTGIESLCSAIARLAGNVRLEKFNAALLFTLIGGTWSGNNAREIACVALEHIPTFLAMLSASVRERAFNNATFTKLVQRKGKREIETFNLKLRGLAAR